MTKTETALGAGLVVTVVALAVVTLQPSARVIVIKDGSVEIYPIQSRLEEDSPPSGPGKKFKWSEKGTSVAVWRCNQKMPDPKPFNLVKVQIADSNIDVTELQIQNEGAIFRKLAVSFDGDYTIEWSGAGHRLQRVSDGSFENLRIRSVTVDGGAAMNFNRNGCIAFQN